MEQKVLIDKEFGRNLWRLRRARGMTQNDMATKLQLEDVDMTRGTYAKIEAGIHHITIEQLKTIRKILDASWEDIFLD